MSDPDTAPAHVAGCSSVRVTSRPPGFAKEADAASLVGHNCNGQPKIESGNGQFVLTDVSLRELIGEAYDLSFGESYVRMTQPAAKLFGVSEWSGNRLFGFDVDMDTFARFLTGGFMIDRPVLNETGLKGSFDFDLMPESGSKDSFIDGLRSQLGLKLEPAIRDINLLVIDQIEEPPSI